MVDLTTAGLISDVKLQALIPDGMYDDADIISFLNDGFFSEVLGFIMRFREDFYVGYTDFSTADSIAIPADAIAQKLKDVQLKKDSKTFLNVPRLSMGEITNNNNYRQNPLGFYIQDNTVFFHPNQPAYAIRLVYFKRPKYLIDSADDTVYTVTAIEDSTNVTVNKAPTVGALTLTLSDGYQPFDTSTISCTGSITTTNHITMSVADTATVTVGDIFCPLGNCAFAKIPLECRDVLVQSAIVKAMASMKDKEGYKIAKDTLATAMQIAGSLISPRIDDEPKKVVNVSPLWSRGNRFGWRGR